MVLLNLAHIPDDVILGLDNFDEGWSIQFKELIDKFYSHIRYDFWNNKLKQISQKLRKELSSNTQQTNLVTFEYQPIAK